MNSVWRRILNWIKTRIFGPREGAMPKAPVNLGEKKSELNAPGSPTPTA